MKKKIFEIPGKVTVDSSNAAGAFHKTFKRLSAQTVSRCLRRWL